MAGAIDFYFDFSSPYGYLAAEMIEALGQRVNRAVNWHPILLGVVFKWDNIQARKGAQRGTLYVMDFGDARAAYFDGEA